jgi:hypothetical protein
MRLAKRSHLACIAAAALWTLAYMPAAAAKPAKPAKTPAYRFGVIGHGGGEAQLKRAIADTGNEALSFVVATGIKGADEPCSDALYSERRALFDEAQRPLILTLAATDWSLCTDLEGRSIAVERLSRLRELYFGDAYSLGTHKLPLTRLSNTAKFRSYAENAYWDEGKVLYATLNLPSNNNHYRPEAGRNNEFEDRLVANRAWLARLLSLAHRKRFDAIVLFSDGDILAHAPAHKRDGYAETRRLVEAIAQKFPGKLLLVDSASAAAPAIKWHGNLGHLSVGANIVEVKVAAGAGVLFSLQEASPDKSARQEKGAPSLKGAPR